MNQSKKKPRAYKSTSTRGGKLTSIDEILSRFDAITQNAAAGILTDLERRFDEKLADLSKTRDRGVTRVSDLLAGDFTAEKYWQEQTELVSELLAFSESLQLVDPELALDDLPSHWQQDVAVLLERLPQSRRLKMPNKFWLVNRSDSWRIRCWKRLSTAQRKGYRWLLDVRNAVAGVFGKAPRNPKPVRRTISIRAFCRYHLQRLCWWTCGSVTCRPPHARCSKYIKLWKSDSMTTCF